MTTAAFGEGHNTAAKNWAAAIQRMDPEADVRVVDLFRSAGKILSGTLEGLYSFAITNVPGIWKWLYKFADSADFAGQKVDIFAPLRVQLSRILADFRPDIIVNTYHLYPLVLKRVAKLYPEMPIPPIYTMVTDSVSINSVWMAAPSDRYLVTDTASKHELISGGTPADKIEVTGFPVSPLLTELPCNLTAQSRPPRILYFPCTSSRHVAKTLNEIPKCFGGQAKWTLVLGHHKKRLYHTMRRFTDAHPNLDIEVLGWTDQVPELMRSHHVIVGKAGGATVHEALTARCPMIINYVVPGQEEGNADMLTSHRCALQIKRPDQLPAALDRILGPNGKWDEMRAAAARLREPLPSARLAQIVLESFSTKQLVSPTTASTSAMACVT